MDWPVLAFVSLMAVVLAVVAGQAIGRARVLDDIGEVLGTGGGERSALPQRVRAAVERTASAEWDAAQQRRDAAYLADLIGVGVIRVDDALRIQLANAAAHAFLDRPPGSMVGRTVIEAFVDRRVEHVIDTARRLGAATAEVAIRDADGPRLVVRARRSPVTGAWAVLEDVTELRHLQQIRAEFIDNLSHELRTPLTTVSLLAETLGREARDAGPGVSDRMRERIAKLEEETGHIAQMVNELMDLSRIESGAAVLHLDDVDVARLAAESTDRLRLFADRQGVPLRVEVAEAVPLVRGDEARLGQVFVNLLHNAVKFSEAGGEVVVRVGRDGDQVVASVEDHGSGIPRASVGRVFERFYKVDRARVPGGGTGLGLAIARHVIQQHGGRIWVESEEGMGSTFSFALPLAEERPMEEHAE